MADARESGSSRSPAERSRETGDRPLAIPDLGDIVGYQMSLAIGTIRRHFDTHCSHLGLTQKQVAILWILDDSPDTLQAELAKILKVARASVSAQMTGLFEKKYIKASQDPADRRRMLLRVTAAGQDALGQGKKATEMHEQWLASQFSADERLQLLGMLQKIHQLDIAYGPLFPR
ncbi:MarR family winged helix-turn-helix transcriptional regulator [Parasphingopyxis marina]|uniref:Winged helix-turn-helix transcriptional regulator n=1 Tax=Parasphingopyxis marina TaxID=2761622 RepID=A0A842I0B0_9SPHN|nr:MarR family winged helix-turn-helix transcriptional regulator [Parasphingopyxis marina]MBC2777194.1 winged helix-turn-helix transcriptional regulator [Parasphingopyxis marina]